MAAITNPIRMISAAKIIPEDGIDGIPLFFFSHRSRQWNFFPTPPFTEAKVKATLPIYSRHFLLASPSLNLGTDKLANSIDGNYNGRHCRGRSDPGREPSRLPEWRSHQSCSRTHAKWPCRTTCRLHHHWGSCCPLGQPPTPRACHCGKEDCRRRLDSFLLSSLLHLPQNTNQIPIGGSASRDQQTVYWLWKPTPRIYRM